MKKFSIHGASWDSMFLTCGKILTMFFSIISAKMMSEGLSLTEYGTYSQANMISTVGTSLILLGLGDALSFYFNGKQPDIDDQLRSRIVNTVFFLELFVGLGFAVFIIARRNLLIDYFGNAAVRILIPIAAFLPVLTNSIYFYQIVYVAVGKAKLMSVYSLVMTIVRIITIYVAVYVVHSLLVIFIVLILMDMVQIAIYNNSLAKKGVRINPLKISKKYIRPIFAYGLPMGIYSVAVTLIRELAKLVVGRMAGTEELAIYTNCSKLLPVDVIVNSFALVLLPYIISYVTEKDREKSIDLFASYLRVGYYSVWILGTMLLIAPETMISFLYDDKYLPGVSVFVLYIFDSMFRFATMHQVLVASSKTKLLMFYSIGCLLLSAVLNILFYYLFGLIGPAIATLVTGVIYSWLVLRKSMKLICAEWMDIFNIKELAWLALTLAGLWLVCTLMNKGLINFGIHAYVSMIISMIIFGCSALVIHLKKIMGVLKKINHFYI